MYILEFCSFGVGVLSTPNFFLSYVFGQYTQFFSLANVGPTFLGWGFSSPTFRSGTSGVAAKAAYVLVWLSRCGHMDAQLFVLGIFRENLSGILRIFIKWFFGIFLWFRFWPLTSGEKSLGLSHWLQQNNGWVWSVDLRNVYFSASGLKFAELFVVGSGAITFAEILWLKLWFELR
jgi:hypothetical protein